MAQPTAFEQEMLELINRARANPAGDYGLLIENAATQTGTTANITGALRYFNVDALAFQTALSGLPAVAPLAWNTVLASAAEAHSALMIAQDEQDHQLPGEASLGARIRDAGYASLQAVAENIYAYADSALDGHAGFMIDWGFDAEDRDGQTLRPDWQSRGDGMQDPAGHRLAILSDSYTEVGIGVIAENLAATQVGPFVVTQDFGNRFDYAPQLLGVVMDDADSDGRYDAGEGLGGVAVTVLQGGSTIASTVTWDAGGYQVALAPGSYTVRFSGGGLGGTIERQITMGSQNLKIDGLASDAQAGATEGADTLAGTPGAEAIEALGGADWITPGGGSDTVDGGAGRDMVSFFDLADTPGRTNLDYRLDIDLGAGTAVNHDGSETVQLISIERVTGTIFADRMTGDAGDNEFRGLGDYDWFVGTEGNDSYDGGTGRDVISYAEATGGVTVNLGAGRGTRGQASGDIYTSVERVTGSGFADLMYGDDGENDFRGLGGYDTFVGSAGGRERYDGGAGIDTVTYFQSDAGVTASLLLGYGSGGDAARDLYTSIENLGGTSFDDILTGDHGRNNLRGLGGDDMIFANGGIDYITGGAGDDTIDGGAGSDYAIFSGDRAGYTLTRAGDSVTVSGADGTDLLTDVEYFRFDDMDVTIWSL